MISFTTRSLSALAAAALLTTMLVVPATAAGPVSVQVNGTTLSLNPPPTERAGRVFVPLRGIFENLGASVVYAGGVINATGRGHNISLRIGSQQATVDGQPQTIDVAPFIIGASTYVPLRFVSQALGANVNYDGANNIVAISASGVNAPPNQTITPAPNANGQNGAITLVNLVPARGASVSTRRPTIEATFAGGTADPNSVRVSLDGLDVTAESTRSPRFFSYATRSPLQAGEHAVQVRGTDTSGNPFSRSWRFSSGTSTASVGQITNVRPADGATVGSTFTVSGRTTPGARVTIQIGAASSGQTTIGGLIGAILGGSGNQGNTASYVVTANANGGFAQQVSIQAPSGTQLAIAINATDTQTGATAVPVQERVSIQ
jgi:hypothetical protein